MSDNKAFKLDLGSKSPIEIKHDSEEITIRFNGAFPREISYEGFKDPFEAFSERRTKVWDEIEKHLKANGTPQPEIMKLLKEFSTKTTELRRQMVNGEIAKKRAAIEEQLVKACNAVIAIAKTKILDYAHDYDEYLDELEEGFRKIGKEVVH